MVKDTTATFFTDETKPVNPMGNPDNASKWIGVAEKGISLIENLINMRKAKEGIGGGETSAYEKGLSRGIAQAPAVVTPQPVKINYKTTEAVEYLKTSLSKLEQDKTIKQYLEGEIKDMETSGILNAGMEHFLKSFVEVSQ